MIRAISRDDIRNRIHDRIRHKVRGTGQRPRLAVYRSLKHISVQKQIGKVIAERAKEHGIKQVVFDRGGYLYHGRVKALADAAREAGLEF